MKSHPMRRLRPRRRVVPATRPSRFTTTTSARFTTLCSSGSATTPYPVNLPVRGIRSPPNTSRTVVVLLRLLLSPVLVELNMLSAMFVVGGVQLVQLLPSVVEGPVGAAVPPFLSEEVVVLPVVGRGTTKGVVKPSRASGTNPGGGVPAPRPLQRTLSGYFVTVYPSGYGDIRNPFFANTRTKGRVSASTLPCLTTCFSSCDLTFHASFAAKCDSCAS